MTYRIEITSLENIQSAARKFIEKMGNRRVFAFYGEMGAGKTTFIKAVCQAMGVQETVTSPTFAIINEYHTSDNAMIYHFDFYRIKNIEEAYDFGYEDYFYSGHICLIEWPQLVAPLLPENAVKISIKEQLDGLRVVQFNDI